MINSTNMLQVLIDGQKRMESLIKDTNKEVKKNGKRIDKLGLELAELSDDAPTIEEFDNLEKRVTKVENQVFASK